MIPSFLYGTWMGGQVLYWFLLKEQTAVVSNMCWQLCLRKR